MTSAHSTPSAEARCLELGLTIPAAPAPAGLYKRALVHDGIVYIAGHVSMREDGSRITGRVGAELDVHSAKLAARQCGLAILATLRQSLGSLDRIARVIRVFGMVNATPDFQEHPAVLDGCSQLFADVFGADEGVGVRSAAGMASLPGNVAVEIDAVFAMRS
jgi:enamine deaminase RidA (YjgF/YER057c/UK114 family)